jgi:hypothetical protein
MTNLTRTQSAEMWKLISKGGLMDIEANRPLEKLGGMSPMEFVEQVAAKILVADTYTAKSRPTQIAMAAGLGGKISDTEMEIRRAVSVLCDFHDGATVVEGQIRLSTDAMKIAVKLMRIFLGYDETKNSDPQSYEDRSRQVRNWLEFQRM